MIIFSIVMLLISAIFISVGIMIYRGNTNLIHDYHQTKVTDKANYGKEMGKAVVGIAASAFLSGVISLLGKQEINVLISVAVFIIGFADCFAWICRIQKKYNGGMF